MRIIELQALRWIIVIFGFIKNGIAAAGPLSLPYTAAFEPSTIQLEKAAFINYQVNLTSAGSTLQSLFISLCQTSSKTFLGADSTNTWLVLTALSDFCLTNTAPEETCKNQPYKGRSSLLLNLTSDAKFNATGKDTLSNFFFCFSNGASAPSIVCDYSSSLFDISPAVPGSESVDSDIVATMPPLFPSPTHLALKISSTNSALLQLQTSDPILTSPQAAAPKTSKLRKKPLATGVKIGIGFGILSLILAFGFLALFLIRRARLKSNAQADKSLNIDTFSHPNIQTEKNSVGSPTSPSVWKNSQTRTLIPGQAPGQESEQVVYNRQITPTSEVAGHEVTSLKNISLDGNEQPSNLPVHNRRSMSVISRESVGSVSISPIPSPQSTVFDNYKDGIGNHARMSVGMGMGIGSTAPYLREEGMSAEEVAKLEEEERRIDAAIAEAEAERALGRR